MTLAEWAEQSEYRVGEHGAARWVPDVATDRALAIRSQLWDLDDYRVSSVSGGTIWLMPRTGPHPAYQTCELCQTGQPHSSHGPMPRTGRE
jgi:hypothetical protein